MCEVEARDGVANCRSTTGGERPCCSQCIDNFHVVQGACQECAECTENDTSVRPTGCNACSSGESAVYTLVV